MTRRTTPPPLEGAAPAASVHPALRALEDGVGRRWLEALLAHGERADGTALPTARRGCRANSPKLTESGLHL
jgi:hypothetical protein